jgi:hypothetical protein
MLRPWFLYAGAEKSQGEVIHNLQNRACTGVHALYITLARRAL